MAVFVIARAGCRADWTAAQDLCGKNRKDVWNEKQLLDDLYTLLLLYFTLGDKWEKVSWPQWCLEHRNREGHRWIWRACVSAEAGQTRGAIETEAVGMSAREIEGWGHYCGVRRDDRNRACQICHLHCHTLAASFQNCSSTEDPQKGFPCLRGRQWSIHFEWSVFAPVMHLKIQATEMWKGQTVIFISLGLSAIFVQKRKNCLRNKPKQGAMFTLHQ